MKNITSKYEIIIITPSNNNIAYTVLHLDRKTAHINVKNLPV